MTRIVLACLSCTIVLSTIIAWLRRVVVATDSVLFAASQRVLVVLFYARSLVAVVGLCLLATQLAWMIGGVP